MANEKENKKLQTEFATALGNRIAQVAEIIGGKKQLARQLKTYESNIYRYINGETSISARMLVDIAKVAEVDVDWLATGDGAMFGEEGVGEDSGIRVPDTVDSYVRLPRYEIRSGDDNVDEPIASSLQIVDYVSFKRAWLSKELKVSPANAVLVQAGDNAMAATIDEGDLVLLDANHTHLSTDGLFAFIREETIVLRRFQRMISGGHLLLCDNPAYAAEEVENIGGLDILGKAVWVGKRL